MTRNTKMQFSREVDAARIRIRALARDIKTHQQQGEEEVSVGPYKVIFRATCASQPDSIRFQLEANKAMTLRLNQGRVRITNLTAVGPRALEGMVNEWTPLDTFLAIFATEEAKRAWRSVPVGPVEMEKLLATVLVTPARPNLAANYEGAKLT